MKNMAWFVKALNKDENGFTLVELIVVIAILGILAAIAVPRFTGTLNQSKNNADKASAQIIADAAARYITDQGSVPDSLTISTLQSAKYLDSNIKPQSGGTSFTITIDKSNNKVSVSIDNGTELASATFEIIQ